MLLNEKDLVRRTSTRHHIVELPAAPQQGARRWKKKYPSEMLLEVLRGDDSLNSETCKRIESRETLNIDPAATDAPT